jgi:hypothetical protein
VLAVAQDELSLPGGGGLELLPVDDDARSYLAVEAEGGLAGRGGGVEVAVGVQDADGLVDAGVGESSAQSGQV